MSINKKLLFDLTISEIKKEKDRKRGDLGFSFLLVKELLRVIIFSDPTKNCIIKGKRKDWNGLPKGKSLFSAENGCGLPIGNLTSQLFGNVYLNKLDHFIKNELKIKYYGRYVDDMLIVHQDKHYLKRVAFEIKNYLARESFLSLHPEKTYLQ